MNSFKYFIFLIFVFVSTPQSYANVCELNTISKAFIEGANVSDDQLRYTKIIDMTKENIRGQTFLEYMNKDIKPALDQFAIKGFKVVDGTTAVSRLNNVDTKVKQQVLKAVGGDPKRLAKIADGLASKGNLTFYQIPAEILKIDRSVDRYELTTYFGLISGGGVALKFYDSNFAYSVNYGTGKVDKDPQTGRSFGQGPAARSKGGVIGANDVSDKDHLQGIFEYVQKEPENAGQFFRTLIEVLANSDTRGFAKLSPLGQTLASDFLAVYVAEQARRLMHDRFDRMEWDIALLEVTLLASFYSRIDEVYIMYGDKFLGVPISFTNTVYNQYPDRNTGEYPKRAAEFYDYWQRGVSPLKDPKTGKIMIDPKTGKPVRTNRSGINITKPFFRVLLKEITAYEKTHHPKLVERIANLLGTSGDNVFVELSYFLVNETAPRTFVENASKPGSGLPYEIADAFANFLDQVGKDGPAILNSIKNKDFSKTSSGQSSSWNRNSGVKKPVSKKTPYTKTTDKSKWKPNYDSR